MERNEKQAWVKAELVDVGSVAEIVRAGEGKLSTAASDPGESRKIQPDEIT
ncbi:MAG: hypothetical protein ACREI7_00805 [Myxococcota bacterium]